MCPELKTPWWSSNMLLRFSLLSLVAGAVAHGSGAWKDLNHYKGSDSFAGMRYVSEGPPHKLTMVGSDDGESWWSLTGFCDGGDMTNIHFDFSSKGGPKDLTGKWAKDDKGKVTITWPDGGVWELAAETSDSKLVPVPISPPPPKPCCNCACGSTGQCGSGCYSCDCDGCCPPPKPLCNCACGSSGQCGSGCYSCDCEGCA